MASLNHFETIAPIEAAIELDADVSLDKEDEEEMPDPWGKPVSHDDLDSRGRISPARGRIHSKCLKVNERLSGIGSSILNDSVQRAHWFEDKWQDCLTQLADFGDQVELSNP
jgi:hypothetical protein